MQIFWHKNVILLHFASKNAKNEKLKYKTLKINDLQWQKVGHFLTKNGIF
jgi:hypothetical protein